MPLPPAPKKRAARLSPDQSEAATPAAKTRATAPTAKTSAASAATTAAGQKKFSRCQTASRGPTGEVGGADHTGLTPIKARTVGSGSLKSYNRRR